MTKIVINACFGGFGLSRVAIKRLAELQGRACYFFKYDMRSGLDKYIPDGDEKRDSRDLFWIAFDIPNPNEIVAGDNEKYNQHSLESCPENRADPLLVQVVRELGDAASGRCAELKIIEIPDGVEWEIDGYDGSETVDEKHRSWS